MLKLVNYFIVVVGLVIVVLVLMQSKGGGLGSVFGGEGNVHHTKRGLEKGVFISTIVLSVVFVALCLTAVFLQR